MFFWTEGKIFIIDEWVRAWDALTVKKHLDRLLTKGMITCSNDRDGFPLFLRA